MDCGHIVRLLDCNILLTNNENKCKKHKVGIIYDGSQIVIPFKDRLHALRYMKPNKSTHNTWWYFKSRGLEDIL
jgi:hypothetical protein